MAAGQTIFTLAADDGREVATAEICGIYLWDSKESLASFRASELARSIPDAYAVVATPRIETFEVLFPLREMPPAVAVG